MYLLLFIHRY